MPKDYKKSDSEIREAIVAQSLRELQWARQYKQGKIKNWQINETMYYTKAIKQSYATGLNYSSTPATGTVGTSRSNVNLARMQEFIHTLQAKTNTGLIFKYKKKKESQLDRVARLNALATQDRDTGFWDLKALVAKKQVFIYGRAQFCYYSDSYNGYCSHLDPVDVYDFLIDPSGGGIDYELAKNMGRYGVIKTKEDLQDGIDEGIYDKDSTTEIMESWGNNTESPQEETNKMNRMYGQGTVGKKELTSDNKYKFWEWYTTFYNPNTKKSERYYLLMQERAGKALRVAPLTELFGATKEFPLGPWPFWGYAAFPDLTEYWTPGEADYARELIMAQDVSINQMLDNSEAINKPMRKVQVGAIENMAELKYRRDGIIRVKRDVDINKAYEIVQTPAIDAPLKVFDKLEQILQRSTGVTDQAKGIDNETSTDTLGIYEGNREEADDRFELLNTSESFGYKRFAKLYELGVKENLTKKIAVEMIGPDGVQTEEISKRDMFKKGDTFGITVEASDAEDQQSDKTQATKLKFLDSEFNNQITWPIISKMINAKKLFEMKAKIAGFSEDDIKELTDTSEYGNSELMSEAAKDIESLYEGENIKPNSAANNAYKQKLVDYMIDNQEVLMEKPELFARFAGYINAISPIVMTNEARALNQHLINTLNTGGVPPQEQSQPQQTQPQPTNQQIQ